LLAALGGGRRSALPQPPPNERVVALLITTYLLLVFLVPILVSAMVSYRALPSTTACPHCTRDTVPIQARGGRVGNLVLRRLRLRRRWCMSCDWTGVMRPAFTPPVIPTGREPTGAVVHVLEVRSLRLDGRTWRVQLQCWEDAYQCHGRLVFVDVGGRPWPDAFQAFSARTQVEVLGQALSIPDRALASRLRQLMTAD